MSFKNLQKMNRWLVSNLLDKYKSETQLPVNPAATAEARARNIFNQLVQIRLSLLPYEIQLSLLKILNSSSVTYEIPFAIWGINGFAGPSELSVSAHGALRDSAFVLQILIHEIEHQIQFLRFTDLDFTHWRDSQGMVAFFQKVGLRYEQEFGAMYMQWLFFQLLPREDTAYWQQKLNSVDAPIFRDRFYLQRQLDGAQLPFAEYLEREHRAGRYSLRDISKSIWAKRKGDQIPLF